MAGDLDCESSLLANDVSIDDRISSGRLDWDLQAYLNDDLAIQPSPTSLDKRWDEVMDGKGEQHKIEDGRDELRKSSGRDSFLQLRTPLYNERMQEMGVEHSQRSIRPPLLPSDANPPCNTLYVGNLPRKTTENELRDLFSKQRGYKRLCYRSKANGPMCFVEFENVSSATKAMIELYGHVLDDGEKGGIRLSFSKNPLGIRTGVPPVVHMPTPKHLQRITSEMATSPGLPLYKDSQQPSQDLALRSPSELISTHEPVPSPNRLHSKATTPTSGPPTLNHRETINLRYDSNHLRASSPKQSPTSENGLENVLLSPPKPSSKPSQKSPKGQTICSAKSRGSPHQIESETDISSEEPYSLLHSRDQELDNFSLPELQARLRGALLRIKFDHTMRTLLIELQLQNLLNDKQRESDWLKNSLADSESLGKTIARYIRLTILFLYLKLAASFISMLIPSLKGAWHLHIGVKLPLIELIVVSSILAAFHGQLKCYFLQAWLLLQDKYGAVIVRLVANRNWSFSRLTRKQPVSLGKKLTLGQCRCGHRFYDEFIELRPAAAARYEESLRRRSLAKNSRTDGTDKASRTQSDVGVRSVNPQDSSLTSTVLSWIGRLGFIRKQTLKQNDDRTPLPRYELEQGSAETRIPSSCNNELLYLLLCIPHHQYATRLLQPQVSAVKSDKDLFPLLRQNYLEMRGRIKALFSLKVLRGIKFVQLEMYKSELVDIRKQDDFPPEDKKDEYRYHPIPAEIVPPVGENHMLHLINHPSHAEDDGLLLNRIPKKLRERLLVCPSRGTGLGWGIHFIEGWHTSVITLVSFAVLLAGSLAFLVCWLVLKHDVQGASGVAAYVVAFLGLGIGSVHAAFELT